MKKLTIELDADMAVSVIPALTAVISKARNPLTEGVLMHLRDKVEDAAVNQLTIDEIKKLTGST